MIYLFKKVFAIAYSKLLNYQTVPSLLHHHLSPFHVYLTVRSFFAMISRHMVMVMGQNPGFLGILKQLVNGWLFLQIWYYIKGFDKSNIMIGIYYDQSWE